MRMKLLAITVLALATTMPGEAAATAYNVIHLTSQAVLCRNVQATTHKGAFIQCLASYGVGVPPWAATITDSRVCRSTHRVQPQNGLSARWAYDARFPQQGC